MAPSQSFVEPIRTASRQLVRELGFMNPTLAGTSYPPSEVHGLIEIGNGNATTLKELCDSLNLEDWAVRRLLQDLIDTGEVEETNIRENGEHLLSLTAKGRQTLVDINTFAQDQVLKALGSSSSQDVENILIGLQTYVSCLHAQPTKAISQIPQVEIVRGYQPGLIGRALEMHLSYYSQFAGFGAFFESQLAQGLGDLVTRMDHDRNEAWTAKCQGRIVGTLFIDGQGLGQNTAHLRAFIVDGNIRGGGVGRRLLTEATNFVDSQQFEETHLWTFQGLDAARRLYESFGFLLKEQCIGRQWGEAVTEQLFIRKLHEKRTP